MELSAPSQWFREQLQSSAEGFEWAVTQVQADRLFKTPPAGLGEWSAARHLYHLEYYEQNFALPGMQQWLGGSLPVVEDDGEDRLWSANLKVENLLAGFKQVRNEQIALLPKFDARLWKEKRETGWGSVTLQWVVSKTYQHTAEHISDVLRIALFWEVFASRVKGEG